MKRRGEASHETLDLEAQVRKLVKDKRAECRQVVGAFRKLGRGRRRELGLPASYLVSVIEDELCRRSKKRKKSSA